MATATAVAAEIEAEVNTSSKAIATCVEILVTCRDIAFATQNCPSTKGERKKPLESSGVIDSKCGRAICGGIYVVKPGRRA